MKEQEQKLLEQGIKEYVDALNAINAFRLLIQTKFREVVKTNLKEYSAALGIEESRLEIKEHERSDGKEFYLGIKCFPKDTSYAEFGHGFYWEHAEGAAFETGIWMWVWSKRRNLERLREVLRQKALHHDGGDQGVWLLEKITASDVSQIEGKLDDMMERWIDLWRKAGGIAAMGEGSL